MRLTLAVHSITAIRFAGSTGIDGTTLSVDKEDLRRLVVEDPAIESVDFELVTLLSRAQKSREEVPIGRVSLGRPRPRVTARRMFCEARR
jgi:hypothetical protein